MMFGCHDFVFLINWVQHSVNVLFFVISLAHQSLLGEFTPQPAYHVNLNSKTSSAGGRHGSLRPVQDWIGALS